MPVQTLRREIENLMDNIATWNEEIREKRSEIEQLEEEIEELEGQVTDAQASIEDNENEIENLLERDNLVEQLTATLSELSVDQLSELISSLQNGGTPTIQPASEPRNPTVLVVNEGNEEEYEITEQMRNSFLTVVGTSHQPAWFEHHFSPEIGDQVTLFKETITSNCYARLFTPDRDEPLTLGILPTEGSAKTEELENLNLPCKTHQSMWNSPNLQEVYRVTGVIPGKFITLEKANSASQEVEVAEEESSADISTLDHDSLNGTASTIEEAKAAFRDLMPAHCTLIRDEVVDIGSGFIVPYLNHRIDDVNNMRRSVLIRKPQEE